MRQRHQRDDRGVSMVEVLVAMVLMSAVAATAVSSVMWANRTTTTQTRNADLWADIQDASTHLVRDVNDASAITVATANELTSLVMRDDKCQQRAWVADPTAQRLTVTTTFYEQSECTGPTTVKVDRIIGNNAIGTNTLGTNPTRYLAPTTFSFYDSLANSPLADPVEVDRVTRVGWTLLAAADEDYREQELTSGAAFTGRGEVATGEGPIATAAKPRLCLSLRGPVDPGCGPVPAAATGKVEGVHSPVLQWTDTTPTLTQGWSVYRIANPEGTADGDAGRTTWTQAGFIVNPAQTWFVDATLEPGHTAQYVVVAVVPSGVGPTSNQVITGKRPASTLTRANGAATSIAVDWDKVTGATGYDVFRDGVLARSVSMGTTLAWIDQPGEPGWAGSGYGHTHYYRVVPVNRWENRITSSGDDARLPLGSLLSDPFPGGDRQASPQTAASGDFTAPAAPTLAATPNSDWSNTVARTFAPWTGAGPSAGRDRGWVTQTHASAAGWSDLWAEAPGASAAQVQGSITAGAYRYYQALACNDSGCGPYSGEAVALQRPPTPSCTAGAINTRSVTVTTNPPAMESPYTAFDVDHIGGAGAPTNLDPLGGASRGVDQLRHNTTQTFNTRTQNASPANGGWSDPSGGCAAPTPELKVWMTGISASTRTVNATAANEWGTSQNITLEGVRTDAGLSSSWDPLGDGTAFTVTARNSDGYNDVAAQAGIATATVATPGRPTCQVAVNDSISPGGITISGGTQVKLGSGGAVRSGPEYFGSLGSGTYTGYARNTNSDGYTPNDKYSSWDPCGSVTIKPASQPAPQSNATCWAGRGAATATLDADSLLEWNTSLYLVDVRTNGGYYSGMGSLADSAEWSAAPNVFVTDEYGRTRWNGWCQSDRSIDVYDRYGKYAEYIWSRADYWDSYWWAY